MPVSGEPHAIQEQRIDRHSHGRSAHRQRGPLRAQQNSQRRVERAGRNRDRDKFSQLIENSIVFLLSQSYTPRRRISTAQLFQPK
jgi:hypothetical protein